MTRALFLGWHVVLVVDRAGNTVGLRGRLFRTRKEPRP